MTRFVGEEVEAIWSGDSAFYEATIEAINADGTYAILFDDGEKENHVREQDIRDRGLMTPSSSSEGFADDDEESEKKKNKAKKESKKPSPTKKQPPKSGKPAAPKISARSKARLSNATDPTKDMPSILKRPSSSQSQTDSAEYKKQRRFSGVDKWDEIVSISEMKREARAIDSLCRSYASQMQKDRAYIVFLQKQVAARDSVTTNQLLPVQIAGILKEDLMAYLEYHLADPTRVEANSLFQYQQVLSEEAFGQIVEEAEKIQGSRLTSIYQFDLAPLALNQWFGRSICDGLSLKIEYNEANKQFKAFGQIPKK